METAIAVPSKLDERALALTARANAIQVTDQTSHDEAAELYVRLGDLGKEIDAIHDPAIKAAHESHRAALAAKAKLADPVEKARRIIKPKVTAWEQEQIRIRQEKQRAADEAARKADEDARLALAQEAEAKGATPETVDEILETPVVTVAPVVQPAFTRVNGFKARENWYAEVENLWALVNAIAEKKQPLSLVQPNQVALNGMARSLKNLMSVPGVKAVKTMV